jgi:hypothetical protein
MSSGRSFRRGGLTGRATSVPEPARVGGRGRSLTGSVLSLWPGLGQVPVPPEQA